MNHFHFPFTKIQVLIALLGGVTVSVVWGFVFWGFLYSPLNVYENFSPEIKERMKLLVPQGLPTGNFLLGMIHCAVVSALALVLCWVAHRPNQSPWLNFLLVFLAGMMGSIYCQLDGPIWFLLPWKHSLILLIYDLGSWLLLGSVFFFALK